MEKEKGINSEQQRILVAYFSRPGNNYVNGKIVNLAVGNTEVLAQMIQEMTKCDIFQIKTAKPYPLDYKETTDVAGKELREKARPKLSYRVENMTMYKVVFLGYPNWWGTIPMPIATFLSDYDFSGKTIAPFCTNEGSGLGQSVNDIKQLCPQSIILDGLAIRGGTVNKAQNQVSNWLQELGLLVKK
jgi:flavodoxin